MIHSHQALRGESTGNRAMIGSHLKCAPVAFPVALAIVAFAVAGCGNSSKSKPAAGQAADAAAAPEENAEPAANQPRPLFGKHAAPSAPVKPAVAPALARHRPKDSLKWELADLQTGLAARDPQFVPAVLIFSSQNLNDAKAAGDLRGLLERAGQMSDDPGVALPLAPAPAAPAVAAPAATTPVAATKPAMPTPTPAAAPSDPGNGPGRLGRKRGRMGPAGFKTN
jgi:hypothetical protein